ncbi:MAG TPA: hypothetical protein VKB78_13505, partial [Pirellulales bacterium]|nr:hypothetical protein [Pirellulales bacterium]
MKITCPTCSQIIPAENIALASGWAKCSRCNEVFPLADLLPGYSPPSAGSEVLPERPFDAWAIAERTRDNLKIHVPAQGMRGGLWGMLILAIVWNGFVAFWTASALGLLFGGNRAGIHWQNAIFASFSTPFWLAGLGMMANILWMARGTRTVYLDASRLYTEKRCLIWRRRRTLDRSQVQFARVGETKVTNKSGPQYPQTLAEIVFTRGSFALPT